MAIVSFFKLKMYSSYYKNCIVPQCKSTTIKSPNKLFIYVPSYEQIRKKWLKLAKRDDANSLSKHSRMYFCEDHFDLPRDMENYMEYKIMGSVKRIHMKKNCVPTRFNFHSEEQKCDKCMPVADTPAKKGISVKRRATCKKENRKQSLCQTESKLTKKMDTEDIINLCSDLEDDVDLYIIKKEEEIINEEIENLYKDHIVEKDLVVTSEMVHDESGLNQDLYKYIETINGTKHIFDKDEMKEVVEKTKNVNVVNESTEEYDESIGLNVIEEPYDLKDVNLFIKHEKVIALEVDEDNMEYLENDEIVNVKIENLYEDHIIKEELVVGPEIIQKVNSSNYNPNNIECSSLINKQKIKHNKYVCDYCETTFYARCDIEKHILQHNTTKWHCHICSKTFSYQTNLWRHMKTHWNVKPHSCSYCTKTFARKDYLKFHIQTHHVNMLLPDSNIVRVRSTCDLCNKEFSSKHSCNHHQKYSCPMNKNKQKLRKTKLYICDVCDKSYIYRSSLSAHIVRHHTNKQVGSVHECDVCGKKYIKKHNLQCHMQSKHLNSKPYKCKKCKESFTWYSTLAAHKVKMHGRVRGKSLKTNVH